MKTNVVRLSTAKRAAIEKEFDDRDRQHAEAFCDLEDSLREVVLAKDLLLAVDLEALEKTEVGDAGPIVYYAIFELARACTHKRLMSTFRGKAGVG